MEAARLFATISVAGANASAAALKGFAGHVDATQKGMTRIAGGAGQVAGGLTRIGLAAGAAAASGLVAVTKVAIDFQDAFAGVRKTVEGTPAELDALDKSLRNLSTRIPVNYTDLAGIAQEAGALGVKSKDVDAFTEAVARTSAATVGLSTEGAAAAFGKLGTIFKLSGSDYSRLGSVLVTLGNSAASTEGDIIEVAKRFGAAGSEARLSAAQVLGWSSAIASLGPEAEAAGSSLSRTFNNISKYIGLAGQAAVKTGEAFVDPLKVQAAQLRVEAATLRVAKAVKAHGQSSVEARLATIALERAQVSLATAQAGVIKTSNDASSERLKIFADTTGMTVAAFTDFYKRDASGAVDAFLAKLGQMDRFAAQATLKKVGIINTRDINAVLLLSQHIDVLDKSLGAAGDSWTKNTDLMAVSEKRFDTLKAKLTELKNTALVGAAAVGDGLTPALGRLAAKAQQFVKLHMPDLESLGKRIGDSIDGIDWTRVQAGAQTLADIIKTIFDVVRKIPPEIAAAGIALAGLNKVSGGLLVQGGGNVLGGFAQAVVGAGQNLLGAKGGAVGGLIGALGAQRVYVVNWPLGGLGGGGGVPVVAGLGASAILPLAVIATAVAATIAVGAKVNNDNSALASAVSGEVRDQISGGASLADLETSLAAVNTGLDKLTNMWGGQLVAGDAIDQLRAQQAQLQHAIDAQMDKPASVTMGDMRADVGLDSPLGRMTSAIMNGNAGITDAIAHEESQLHRDLAGLSKAVSPAEIIAAARRVGSTIDKGAGSVASTQAALDLLRSKLAGQTDAKLIAAIKAEMARVERRLEGRRWVAGQMSQADRILGGGPLSRKDIADLAAIQRTLRDRGDTHAAATISAKIAAQGRTTTAAAFDIRDKVAAVGNAAKAALDGMNQNLGLQVDGVREAIRQKDFSAYLTIRPQPITINLDGRQIWNSTVKYSGGGSSFQRPE